MPYYLWAAVQSHFSSLALVYCTRDPGTAYCIVFLCKKVSFIASPSASVPLDRLCSPYFDDSNFIGVKWEKETRPETSTTCRASLRPTFTSPRLAAEYNERLYYYSILVYCRRDDVIRNSNSQMYRFSSRLRFFRRVVSHTSHISQAQNKRGYIEGRRVRPYILYTVFTDLDFALKLDKNTRYIVSRHNAAPAPHVFARGLLLQAQARRRQLQRRRSVQPIRHPGHGGRRRRGAAAAAAAAAEEEEEEDSYGRKGKIGVISAKVRGRGQGGSGGGDPGGAAGGAALAQQARRAGV